MATMTLPAPKCRPAVPVLPAPDTIADLLHRLGDIPAGRVRLWPAPGTATFEDLLASNEGPGRKGPRCELVDETFVEKGMDAPESVAAIALGMYVENWNEEINPDFEMSTDGFIRLSDAVVRAPDVGCYLWSSFPDRKRPPGQIPRMRPDFAVEILSPSNTTAEMDHKRAEYFAAGTRLVWLVDLPSRTVQVYTSPTDYTVVDDAGTLDGGNVLPGFTLAAKRWFDRAARSG